MKALVTYYTKTGNTEKLAAAIFEAIEVDKEIMPIEAIGSVENYDIIFCGFPVHAHSVPLPVQSFIKQLPPGKKLAVFSTHGSLRGGQLAVTAMEHVLTLASKQRVIGSFGCRGRVDPKVLEALSKDPEHRAWAEMARSADSHPDAADLEDGRDFARKMMTKASLS